MKTQQQSLKCWRNTHCKGSLSFNYATKRLLPGHRNQERSEVGVTGLHRSEGSRANGVAAGHQVTTPSGPCTQARATPPPRLPRPTRERCEDNAKCCHSYPTRDSPNGQSMLRAPRPPGWDLRTAPRSDALPTQAFLLPLSFHRCQTSSPVRAPSPPFPNPPPLSLTGVSRNLDLLHVWPPEWS